VAAASGDTDTDTALSLLAAAREAPDTVALRIGEQRYTFAELAPRVEARLQTLARDADSDTLLALAGHNTLEMLVTLYALLQARRPALLLHPRLTGSERQGLVDAAQWSAPAMPTDAAFVIPTSGTTGLPRGAVLTRRALLASARASAANMGWQADDCWLLAMPLARVGGLSIVIRCLAARRCVAVAPAFDAEQLPALLEARQVTLVSLVPTMLSQVLDAHPDWVPPPTLRAIQLGGAAASARLLQRAAERRLPIVITYGCTETCSQVVTTPYAGRFEPARWGAGLPLDGVQLRIHGGHIEVRGPMLMAGYLGEPPLDPAAWFDTGDLGEIDAAGCLRVHARRTDLIITGGENVYPHEVERVLEDCPGVRAAAVFGLSDETWGQTVAAALVLDPPKPTERVVLEHAGTRLAPFKRPRRLFIVEALPQTVAGKLDRAGLLALAGLPPAA
jgi:O-succinylbenzoic acid--CoA ligase